MHAKLILMAALLVPAWLSSGGQSGAAPTPPTASPLLLSGKVVMDGRAMPYIIHRLPVSSFPELPDAVRDLLSRRGCLIPQTYEAHHPENVVHASLLRAGSSDWAVLCAAEGTVSLLVFLGGGPVQPIVLASSPETERLQPHDASGVLGFAWGIDPASPEAVHQAQSGMAARPKRLDHDALADFVIDHRTIFHFFISGAWTRVEVTE